MAVQVQSYLFASSPPGFELLSSNWLERRMLGREFANKSRAVSRDDSGRSAKPAKEYEFKDARLVATRDRELDKKRIKEWESSYDCNLDECGGHANVFSFDGVNVQKRVQFADCFGHELAQVRIAGEPTDVPPTLNPETIKRIEGTLPGFSLEHQPPEGSLGQGTTLDLQLLNFKEPHLDLLGLHNRVERLGLTLSSISARMDRKVGGTIEIKKRLREASIRLRFTKDCWKSFTDVQAAFVSIVGGTDHELYSFEFGIPSGSHKVELEFALCYCGSDGCSTFELWDNNDDLNYKIVCHDEQDGPPSFEEDASHIHRIMSAPGDLTMWSVHDFEDVLQPYW